MWRRISTDQAYTCWQRLALYASPRGHQVVKIERAEKWYVLTYSSGGKRHVKAEHTLWWRT